MKQYTFMMEAAVTVHAETEEEARNALIRACQECDEDVDYEGVGVYLPSYSDMKLVEVFDDEDQA